MKKTILSILVLFNSIAVIISCLSGCSEKPKHDIYEIDTELGDHLSVEVYLSGNMHGMYLTYDVTSEDHSGIAMFQDRTQTIIPADPLKHFTTMGVYGNTHFYKLKNVIIYVYNDECINALNPDYTFSNYISRLQYLSKDGTREGKEKLNDFLVIISDLMQVGIFDNIYQYGEILMYEGNDDICVLLQRYAAGNFTADELSINEDSEKTAEEMTEWAKEILERYGIS